MATASKPSINPTSLSNSRFFDLHENVKRILLPIEGHQDMPLVPLEIAVEPILHLFPTNLLAKVSVAKQNCQHLIGVLAHDEAASLMLYTFEWEPIEKCFYFLFNQTLRSQDRQKIKPWFLYLKLILTALYKLPSVEQTVWRGVKLDCSAQYDRGQTCTWWALSSCTNSLEVLESEQFLGKRGTRTLFSIECLNGKDIQKYSYYPTENEIVLLPGAYFIVHSKINLAEGLHLIHLKEIIPPFVQVEPPASSISIESVPSSLLKLSITEKEKTTVEPESTTTKKMSNTNNNAPYICNHCGNNLAGQQYVLKDGEPYCIKCYENFISPTCHECGLKLGMQKVYSHENIHFHEKCFFCSVCKTSLIDVQFGHKNNKLYCKECFPPDRCDKCHEKFETGTKKLNWGSKRYHEKCFKCDSCSMLIGTESFIPKDDKSYCMSCYETLFAIKCSVCLKVIKEGGVTYRTQPFHRECFKCNHCQICLAGQHFRSRDNKPYCDSCDGKLFRTCLKCGVQFETAETVMQFENRLWHRKCFVCDKCGTSLVNSGFLERQSEILCSACETK